MRFVELNKDNLSCYLSLAKEIFEEEDLKSISFIADGYANKTQDFLRFNEEDGCRLIYYCIVENEGVPIGITGMYSFSETLAWMAWFGISPKFRRMGFGRSVLNETINLAKQRGFKQFLVWTDEKSKEALALYESENFQRTESKEYPILLKKDIF